MQHDILKINDISYAYEKSNVLENVSFEGKINEVLVIAGPNGSGKTTLIKLIFDLLGRENGEIIVAGFDNRILQAKKRMIYLSSENNLPQFLTGDEYVRVMCKMYDVVVDEEKYGELVCYYDMKNHINHLIESYSHGMVKKIQLIVAFLIQTDITVVDETLNGLDIESKEVSKVLLTKLAQKNKLVMMCTHDLELAEQIANRVVVLYKGKVRDIVDLNKNVSLVKIFKELIGFKESNYEI